MPVRVVDGAGQVQVEFWAVERPGPGDAGVADEREWSAARGHEAADVEEHGTEPVALRSLFRRSVSGSAERAWSKTSPASSARWKVRGSPVVLTRSLLDSIIEVSSTRRCPVWSDKGAVVSVADRACPGSQVRVRPSGVVIRSASRPAKERPVTASTMRMSNWKPVSE
ncbi:hypothetical protein JOM49_006980 [Amycolatopsis magusensis]|uniref:Uncharacterized protein n=1 Tax=Amycolatopsis magusensis TaxID=882444 RepID=A0ABS4Q2Z5_9PSEU|nr:hypothetical protein [Amycolatopsis magusensis]MBP2185454.1 hypothetical protein [Amycolatopsis magusensis]